MPEIFISYSRVDRDVVIMLADSLEKAGHTVWWDAELHAGRSFEDEINAALRRADVAVILWSKTAVASEWVRAEAEFARKRRIAVPSLIDDTPHDDLPLLFHSLHTIDLRLWSGDAQDTAFLDLMRSIDECVAAAKRRNASDTAPAPSPPAPVESWIAPAVASPPRPIVRTPEPPAKASGQDQAKVTAVPTPAQAPVSSAEAGQARLRRRIIFAVLLAPVLIGGAALAFNWLMFMQSQYVPPSSEPSSEAPVASISCAEPLEMLTIKFSPGSIMFCLQSFYSYQYSDPTLFTTNARGLVDVISVEMVPSQELRTRYFSTFEFSYWGDISYNGRTWTKYNSVNNSRYVESYETTMLFPDGVSYPVSILAAGQANLDVPEVLSSITN